MLLNYLNKYNDTSTELIHKHYEENKVNYKSTMYYAEVIYKANDAFISEALFAPKGLKSGDYLYFQSERKSVPESFNALQLNKSNITRTIGQQYFDTHKIIMCVSKLKYILKPFRFCAINSTKKDKK
nr:hypothetical protein BCU28_06760 [Vibrio cyclitrophicus]